MSSPTDKLAEKIADRLTSENLILAEDENNLSQKLVAGKVSAEDWKVAIEKALMKEVVVTEEEVENETHD